MGNITINGTPATTATTITNQGTSTVRNVPSVFAPGLAAAGIETCLGSVSGGGSFVGTGFSLGGTVPDPSCAARLDARTLWAMGLRKAAVARLCLSADIYRAMPDVCGTYLPQAAPTAYAVAAAPTQAAPTLLPGQVWLVEGKTGADRLCNDYNEAKQRCRVWDGETLRVVSHTRKRVAATQAAPQEAASRPEDKTK